MGRRELVGREKIGPHSRGGAVNDKIAVLRRCSVSIFTLDVSYSLLTQSY